MSIIHCLYAGNEQNYAIISIDNKLAGKVPYDKFGGNAVIDFEVNELLPGYHFISVQAFDDGKLTNIVDRIFYKRVFDPEAPAVSLHYSIDDLYYGIINPEHSSGGYSGDIDVSELSDGLHRITLLAADPLGNVIPADTKYFYKHPVGGNGIIEYIWWINDDHEIGEKIELETPQTSVIFNSLVDVKTYPLNTMRFHVTTVDAGLVLNPVNTFNLSFVDNAGRVGMASSDYVDYNISKEVVNGKIISLTNGDSYRINKIGKDDIMWFSFESLIGDSISLKTDNGCYIDIFDPEGEKIHTITPLNSVNGQGIRLSEEGKHFVALHDPLRNNTRINLEFSSIDRYAILDHSPKWSAKSDKVFFSFVGNGFEHAVAVRLVNESCKIEAKEFFATDYAHLNAQFDLSQLEGEDKYDIEVEYSDFEDENKIVKVEKGFQLKEINPGKVEVSVEFKNVSSNPFPVKIRVRNTGNVPYWGIPLQLGWDNIRAMRSIAFLDADILKNQVLRRSIEEESYKPVITVDDLFAQGKEGGFMPLIIPFLDAEEEIVYTLGFTCNTNTTFNFYAWAAEPWSEGFKRILSEMTEPEAHTNKTRAEEDDGPRPVPENNTTEILADMALDVIADNIPGGDAAQQAANIAEATGQAIGGIVLGLQLQQMEAVKNAYGVDDEMWESIGMASRERRIKNRLVPPEDIVMTALGLDDSSALGSVYVDMRNSMGNCGKGNNPVPSPVTITRANPFDPNDIHGYKAESGSNYVGLSVERIEYEIEFENDPELAGAPANRILISDYLNPDIFDLSTVRFEEIKCGALYFEADGKDSYGKVVDLRPAIDCVAEVYAYVDVDNNNLICQIQSLDAYTFEPSLLVEHGILPVNDEYGSGTGYVRFSVCLRNDLAHDVSFSNKAEIVFNTNEPISTPVWENTTDYLRPESKVIEVKYLDDSTARVVLKQEDVGSGVWKQILNYRENEAEKWNSIDLEAYQKEYLLKIDPDKGYEFFSKVIDLAGNNEEKEDVPEITIVSYSSDPSGIKCVDDSEIRIITGSGWIDFENPELCRRVEVIGEDGVVLYNGRPCRLYFSKGIYIVKMSDKVTKIRI